MKYIEESVPVTCDACGLKCINLQIGVNELSGKRLKLFKHRAALCVHYMENAN